MNATAPCRYKMTHVMDKPVDSLFGFLPVIPGAFSMYRWVAIRCAVGAVAAQFRRGSHGVRDSASCRGTSAVGIRCQATSLWRSAT